MNTNQEPPHPTTESRSIIANLVEGNIGGAKRILWYRWDLFLGTIILTLGTAIGLYTRLFLTEYSAEFLRMSELPMFMLHVGPFPLSIVLANLIGTALLVGLTLLWESYPASERLRIFLATGLCGSLTSYSALSAAIAPGIDNPGPLPQEFLTAPGLALLLVAGAIGSFMRWRWTTRGTLDNLETYASPGGLRLSPSRPLLALLPQHAWTNPSTMRVIASAQATSGINLGASFFAGVVFVLSANHPEIWAIASVSVLGCFSTFSTTVVDAMQAWRHGCRAYAVVSVLVYFMLAVALASVGMIAGFTKAAAM